MAGSINPGPLTFPFGICRMPSRTPGTLGINDQADPDAMTLLGDTPGSLGLCDGADTTAPVAAGGDWEEELMCHAEDRLPRWMGFGAVWTLVEPVESTVTLDESEERSLAITTYFEGDKSMNYQALSGDGDGMATSFGLIQWNFGQDTLGPLLKKMLAKDGVTFANCFGPDAEYETLKKALQTGNQAEECKWARDRIKNKRGAWHEAFMNLGAVPAFNQIQLNEAKASYHPRAIAILAKVREMCPTFFKNIEFRTYAACFDLGVQQGSLEESHGKHAALDAMKKRIKTEKPGTQLDVMKIVVTERGKTASAAWRDDCISRRMGILTGASYKSATGETPAKRGNPQFTLIKQYGTEYVQGL